MRKSIVIPALVVFGTLGAIERTMAQCDDWRAGPLVEVAGVGGYSQTVYATTTWDPDGAGPASAQLVIGGIFETAGGVTVNSIARWDGSGWQPFGEGVYWRVYSLITLPSGFGAFSGQLIVGGAFAAPTGSGYAYGLARWDGSAWQPFGSGVIVNETGVGSVCAMTIAPAGMLGPGPQLVIAGLFDNVDGLTVHNIASWDGSSWHRFLVNDLGSNGLNSTVFSLAMWDPDGAGPSPQRLVAGGLFTRLGIGAFFDAFVDHIAYWNGSTFVQLGPGLNDLVYSISTVPSGNGPFAGQLVAGGEFGSEIPRTSPVAYVARFDGTAWQPIGGDLDDEVSSFSAWDPDGPGPLGPQLIAGGDFRTANGVPVSNCMMRWDGATWQSLGAGFGGDGENVLSLTSMDLTGVNPLAPQLIAGGEMITSGSTPIDGIARFNGSNWQPFVAIPTGSQVFALTQFGASMIAGGTFQFSTPANPLSPNNIAAFDGLSIYPLGSGTNGSVQALKSFNTGFAATQVNHLVAGGSFTTAGGLTANRIAEWTEHPVFGVPEPAWAAMGTGFNGTVNAIERFNSVVYAGGVFSSSGTNVGTLSRIAQWNGSTWIQVGTGLNGACNAMKVYNGSLYVGGSFTTAGGVNTGGLARWDGTSWTAVAGGFNGTVLALEVFNNELFIGGAFPSAVGSPNIARYNIFIDQYGNPGAQGANGAVHAFAVDNGSLYTAGEFTSIGGATAAHIGHWSGTDWFSVRNGTDGTVFALAPFHDEIHTGGTFTHVRGTTINSPGWGKYFETGIPWVANNPISATDVCGGEVSFAARAAQGYSVNYQWRHNGIPVSDGLTSTGTLIAGSHGLSLNLHYLSSADAGTYDVVVSNSCGSDSSLTATLTIDTGPGNGDGNGDHLANGRDIEGLVRMLTTGVSQGRGLCAYDMNGDGVVTLDDIPLFINRLLGI